MAQVLQEGGWLQVGEMLWVWGPHCTQGCLYEQIFLIRHLILWVRQECGGLGRSCPCGTLCFLLLTLFQSNDVQLPIRSEWVTSLLPRRSSGVNNAGEVNDTIDWSYHRWSCAGYYEQHFRWSFLSLRPHLFLSMHARTWQETIYFIAACFWRPHAEQHPRTSLKPCEHFCSSIKARAKASLWIMAYLCTKMQVHSKKVAGVSVMLNDTTLGPSSFIFSCPGDGRCSSLTRWHFFEPHSFCSRHVCRPGVEMLCTTMDGVMSGSWWLRHCCIGMA